MLDESDALSDLTEADLRNDHAICHLESVLTSHHVEEALRDGVMVRNKVTVKEQEYLLQNVTSHGLNSHHHAMGDVPPSG